MSNKFLFLIISLVAVGTVGLWGAGTVGHAATSDNVGSGTGNYLWQSMEVGNLGGVENKPQYAGYQFSPLKDAYATELCGYFKGNHSVNLYDQSFKMLASAQITAYEQWNCAAITPVALAKGQKYYAIAEMSDGLVYYRAGAVLPGKNADATIESGISQEISQPFGAGIKLNTGRIFGLVDVKIMPKDKVGELVKKAGANLVLWDEGAKEAGPKGGFNIGTGTFTQVCFKSFCYSCTNGICAQTDAVGVVKTGYFTKNCAKNICVNCLNGQCDTTGGQVPQYLYQGFFSGDAGSFSAGYSGGNYSSGGSPGGGGSGGGSGDSGGGSGPSFDPAAAARALINSKFNANDPAFIALLAAWGDAHPTEAAQGMTPTFAQLSQFINEKAGEMLIDTKLVSIENQTKRSNEIAVAAAEAAKQAEIAKIADEVNNKAANAITPDGKKMANPVTVTTKGDQTCVGGMCVPTSNAGAVAALKNAAGIADQINTPTSIETRPSDLTTGWGSKMNAPVATDANGKPLYTLAKFDSKNTVITPGNSFQVDTYSTLDNGKTLVSTGKAAVYVDTQAQADAYNSLIADKGGIPVAVRETITASSLLHSLTAATFTNNGMAAGGASAPTAPTSLPAGAAIVTPTSPSPAGQTAASTVVSDWMPAAPPSNMMMNAAPDSSKAPSANDVFSVDSALLNAKAVAANQSAVVPSQLNQVYSGNVKYGATSPAAADKYNLVATPQDLQKYGGYYDADTQQVYKTDASGKVIISQFGTPVVDLSATEKVRGMAGDPVAPTLDTIGSGNGDDSGIIWHPIGPGAMIDQIRALAQKANGWKNWFGAPVALAANNEVNAVAPAVSNVKAAVSGSVVHISANINGAPAVSGVEARVRDKDGRFAAVLILDNGGAGDNWQYDWKDTFGVPAGEYFVDIFAKDASGNFVEQNNAVAFSLTAAVGTGDCKDLTIDGAADKKIDVVFVPCGYGNDMVAFEVDARRQMEQFSKIVPIAQNIGKFNFRAAEIAGLDCAADLKDNMDKDASVFARAARICRPDAVLVLKKNSGAGGGISLSGAGIGFAAAASPFAAIHEFGHAFFYLNDEYSYGCTYADMSNSANCDNSPKCEKFAGLDAGCYAGCTCEGNYRSANDSVMLDPEHATQFSPAADVQILKILNLFE